MLVPNWIKTLPIDSSKLTLDELRGFKRVEQYLNEPLSGPDGWRYFYRCFKFLTAFCFILKYREKHPAFNRCWDELETLFFGDEIFGDGVFIQSWMFCDFPFGEHGQTALDYFAERINADIPDHHYQYFINQMKHSRLGLYQEVMSSQSTIKFREFFTGEVVTTLRTIKTYNAGDIFLTRLVDYNGEIFQFCDPKCWPKQFKGELENNILGKMHYFDGATTEELYKTYMKLAGPYWFSCVTNNDDLPILPPDHFRTYFQS